MTLRSPMELATWLDGVLTEPVVVIGSPPDAARDLDLLCPETAAQEVASTLAAAGFVEHSHTWARFDECGAEVVDLLPVAGGAVPAAVVARLFAMAEPAPGCHNVRLPAPHHQLLLLARRTAGERGPLTPRRRARLDRLSVVPEVWEQAGAEARDWSARRALDQLRDRGSGRPPGRVSRARARLEQTAGEHPRPGRWSALRPRRTTSPIFAFCGLDGSGKSTQAQALAETLELLGYSVVRRWSRLTYDPSVERVAAPVKRLLRLTARIRPGVAVQESGGVPPDPAQRSSARQGALASAWTLTLVALHSLGHRRALRAARGSVVIWDRYLVDAVVQLRTDYAARTDTVRPERLLHQLSPRPLVTFFLDVPPEVAASRKDDFSVDELALHRQEYVDVVDGHDVVRLDGTRPPSALCREIIATALQALGETC